MLQWLIDTVYDAVMAAIGPHTPFVDRGNVTAWDWTQATLTTDGAWHDMDVSGIVPVGTKAVVFQCTLRDGLVNSYIQIRTKGNANTFNSTISRTEVANVYIDDDLIVAPNSSRLLEYRTANRVFTNINLCLKGWWL